MSITPDNVFKRLTVEYAVEGGSRVSWFLANHFADPPPHTFQLQVARTSAPTATDWEDVGTPVVDTFFAIDDEKRVWGKDLEVHYRVEMTTTVDVYYSMLGQMTTLLSYRDWLDLREFLRQYKKSLRKYKGTEGLLLKRKHYGPRCQTCIDPLTEEGTRSDCPECHGTEISIGYYRAIEEFYVDMTTAQAREKTDLQARGTTKDVNISGLCAGDILIESRDVWIEKNSDRRWEIETVKTESEHRGSPICLNLELRQLPFSDTIYRASLTGA